jgi:hypothetical protein
MRLSYTLFPLAIFCSLSYSVEKKTCFIPLSDAYPNRYVYHKQFSCNRDDAAAQWLCRGTCLARFQNMIKEELMTQTLFDNPLVATTNPNNLQYNAGTLGLGFGPETKSKSIISTGRNSFFIDCTVEIAKINSPYYLQIGIPIQRTEQSITFSEQLTSDGKVIRGGFFPEYQPTSSASLESWQNTASEFLFALPQGMTEYLQGKKIGNLAAAQYGILPDAPMTLWALADIYIQIGHDGYRVSKTHFGYYLRGVIPTTPGLKSAWNKYLFYPTIGNVDRAEIGIGLNSTSDLWSNDQTSGTLHCDAYVGYLGKTEQLRPFDLHNGFFSRYGQVKLFSPKTLSYVNKNIRAIDITSESHAIGGCFKSEIVIDFVYQKWQSFFNIGYSFKSQSKENMTCLDKNQVQQSAQGRLFLFGFSPQQYVQTPNPDATSPYAWTTKLITPNSSMTSIDSKDFSLYQNTGQTIAGIPITEETSLTRSQLNFSSALMQTQILNIFFAGYTYEKLRDYFDTKFIIKGGAGISPENYFTPSFGEILIGMELHY